MIALPRSVASALVLLAHLPFGAVPIAHGQEEPLPPLPDVREPQDLGPLKLAPLKKFPERKDELTALKIERYREAYQAYERWVPLYEEGASPIAEIVAAAKDVIESQLALAENDADRILALEQRVKVCEALAHYTEQRAQSGQSRMVELHTANVALLSARIAVLEAKQAPAASTPNRSAGATPPAAPPEAPPVAVPATAVPPAPCAAPVPRTVRGLRRRW